MTVRITLACGDYDRTAALADGRVRPAGTDLNYLRLPVEETFFRMARFSEFDAAEMSLSSYVISLSRQAPFVAIPVFPSRAFRHNGIYVHAGAGINAPGDLAGRTVGVPEYQVTAAVWIRGMLAEHYGLPVEAVRYRTGGLHTPGRVEKLPVNPPGVDIALIPPGATLAEMLAAGEIDALYTPREPEPFRRGARTIRRLWPDSETEERNYYQRTGIFPIMHTVVIRRDVYERDRWMARSLLDAFTAAKRHVEATLTETAALPGMLPWSYQQAARTRELMGEDFWPYGFSPNRETLSAFLRYSFDEGLADRGYDPAELFAPETLETHVI